METKAFINRASKVVLSLVLGGAILYWMYRGFDFAKVKGVLLHEMDWTWMLLSLPFGALAQLCRGWRWKLSLHPLGEHPRTATAINSIFLSYAVSLVIPRIGEFARCGVLTRYDGVSFAKALGTVVTERAIDSLVVLFITGLTLLLQAKVFTTFFTATGTSVESVVGKFSWEGWLVTILSLLAIGALAWLLVRKLSIYNKVKTTISGIGQGVMSLRRVRKPWLFVALTLGIWASYFIHYYLTFFCFEATAGLGLACAMVTFVVGSVAVIVPTPNGAGPWHFAVKTMLVLYGVAEADALYFVLIVHSVQTLLVVLLGVYAWLALSFTRKTRTQPAFAQP